ncbi:hypothetical protein TGME49_202030 [Toxoplasma gondii ME49]|uniref:Poly(ADP-ribose) polymerase catalytic domain protein n=1 Tax=Toxoplasma gondii (strain ATCC 50611 / Me49) TaxID=508771 RepID=S8GEK9_TOXGM|nr:hypothetical protein TGME49_202030 [Toxoplasma gondii ME49]EPT30265.1 hypothetical protein TGME49_202030 [Toxoplasma gondii ME49]|eukprot:XP_018637426.1 hypothetical protein TGME49_202030 [Toxoplasma gondii ME49]
MSVLFCCSGRLADGWISERRRGPIVPARTLPGNPAVRFATSLLGAGTLTSRASGVLSSGTDTGIRKCKITTSGGGCLFAVRVRDTRQLVQTRQLLSAIAALRTSSHDPRDRNNIRMRKADVNILSCSSDVPPSPFVSLSCWPFMPAASYAADSLNSCDWCDKVRRLSGQAVHHFEGALLEKKECQAQCDHLSEDQISCSCEGTASTEGFRVTPQVSSSREFQVYSPPEAAASTVRAAGTRNHFEDTTTVQRGRRCGKECKSGRGACDHCKRGFTGMPLSPVYSRNKLSEDNRIHAGGVAGAGSSAAARDDANTQSAVDGFTHTGQMEVSHVRNAGVWSSHQGVGCSAKWEARSTISNDGHPHPEHSSATTADVFSNNGKIGPLLAIESTKSHTGACAKPCLLYDNIMEMPDANTRSTDDSVAWQCCRSTHPDCYNATFCAARAPMPMRTSLQYVTERGHAQKSEGLSFGDVTTVRCFQGPREEEGETDTVHRSNIECTFCVTDEPCDTSFRGVPLAVAGGLPGAPNSTGVHRSTGDSHYQAKQKRAPAVNTTLRTEKSGLLTSAGSTSARTSGVRRVLTADSSFPQMNQDAVYQGIWILHQKPVHQGEGLSQSHPICSSVRAVKSEIVHSPEEQVRQGGKVKRQDASRHMRGGSPQNENRVVERKALREGGGTVDETRFHSCTDDDNDSSEQAPSRRSIRPLRCNNKRDKLCMQIRGSEILPSSEGGILRRKLNITGRRTSGPVSSTASSSLTRVLRMLFTPLSVGAFSGQSNAVVRVGACGSVFQQVEMKQFPLKDLVAHRTPREPTNMALSERHVRSESHVVCKSDSKKKESYRHVAETSARTPSPATCHIVVRKDGEHVGEPCRENHFVRGSLLASALSDIFDASCEASDVDVSLQPLSVVSPAGDMEGRGVAGCIQRLFLSGVTEYPSRQVRTNPNRRPDMSNQPVTTEVEQRLFGSTGLAMDHPVSSVSAEVLFHQDTPAAGSHAVSKSKRNSGILVSREGSLLCCDEKIFDRSVGISTSRGRMLQSCVSHGAQPLSPRGRMGQGSRSEGPIVETDEETDDENERFAATEIGDEGRASHSFSELVWKECATARWLADVDEEGRNSVVASNSPDLGSPRSSSAWRSSFLDTCNQKNVVRRNNTETQRVGGRLQLGTLRGNQESERIGDLSGTEDHCSSSDERTTASRRCLDENVRCRWLRCRDTGKMMRHASHTLCVRAAPECSAPPEPVVTVSRRVCCCDYSENPSRFAGNCERHAGEAVCDCLPCRRCGGFPAPSSGCRGGTSQIGWGHCSRCYACGGRAPEQAISLSWEALTSVRLLTEIASALPHYPSHGHFLEEEQILLLDWQYQLGQRRMESGVPPCVQHGDATRSLTSPKRDVSHDGHQGNSGTNADEAGQGAMAGRGKCEWSRTTGANVGSSSCVVDACLASAGRHQAASMRPFARDGFGESTAENRPRRDGGLPRSLGSLATKLGVYKELLQPGDSHYDFCVVAACLNEFFLFHGCKADRAELIAVSGFDFRRGGENRGKLFGVGTYFSPLASKADLYTRPIREPSTTAPAGVRAGSVASSSTAVRAPSSNQVQSGAAKVDGSGSRGTFSNSKNNFTSVFKRGARTSTSHCSGRQTEAQPREERRGSKSRVRRLLAFASYGLWEGNNGGNGHNEVESPLSGTRAPLTSGDCGETRGECLACTRSFASVARIPRARSYCCRGLPGSSMINFPDEFQNGEDDNKLEEDDRDFREAQRQPSSENGISQRGEDTDGASANPKTAIRTLVLSRVCLGEVYKATRAMPEARMPPPMPGVSMDAFRGPCHPVVGSGNAGGGTSGTASSTSKGGIDALVCNPTFSEPQLIHYDSVMAENRTRGGVVDSIEFVVFERGQALPLYCITYTHDPSCCCASCYRYD